MIKFDWKVIKHYLVCIAAIVAFNAVNNLFKSDVTGDIKLLHRDEKGRFSLVDLNVNKNAPKSNNANLISIDAEPDGSKTIDYKRKVFSIGGVDVYAGVGYRDDADGGYAWRGGISFSF